MNGKLRIGVFGAYRGMTMIRVLLNHPDAVLTAICDRYEPALRRAAEEAQKAGLEGLALYSSFEDFFRHDMDAVVLANYANEHAPYAIRLLRSGRHVMSEVLPCQTMAEAVALIEAVEQSGKVYTYAENYCYMDQTFEMWRRYERGDIGEIMYGEGEYIHDCSGIWPSITYGDPDHWRNHMYPTFYCTHSIGPLLAMTGRRPVSVTGFMTNQNTQMPPQGWLAGHCAGIEIITLDNGAVIKSVHGHLKREPGSINYEVYGMKGSMESQRFLPSYAPEGQQDELQVYREGEELCRGTAERYVPQKQIASDLASNFSTHGGSDFYTTHFFIERILGRPDGLHYAIDVYRAVDMGICGILAYRSILGGGVPVAVPDLRDPAQRDAWRNDNACTDPRVAGEQLLPCLPGGNIEQSPEVYAEIRRQWLSKQN